MDVRLSKFVLVVSLDNREDDGESNSKGKEKSYVCVLEVMYKLTSWSRHAHVHILDPFLSYVQSNFTV